jgi:subtilisin family serine protease
VQLGRKLPVVGDGQRHRVGGRQRGERAQPEPRQLRREPGRHRVGGAADGHAVRAEQGGAAHLRHRQRRQQATNGYTGGIGYPARFDECMAVGATNWSDRKASYSNYGAQIEISAPGGDSNAQGTAAGFILAPLHSSNSYTWKTGTSMATPQVAGLAALLYATGMRPPREVRARIVATAERIEAPG